ncbi:hypothetical protein ACFOUP_05470 [Belliella kenyensis]|uniref:Secreted protein n=1 Tax=Belliella kenyensis TaxID=1472724 RepID=A0ABV8EJQ5_9BACT|nr:hypothetical protein [Belliella kenyensis]MCH7402744.1 hypothetical protein [Belliella kenyensis]MDN3603708.1 hypothetical protein [Belliella kenyensis]
MFSKIKITLVACMLFVAGGMMMSSNSEAQINPDCPNGCLQGSDGCFCFQEYQELSEFDWGDSEAPE